MVEEALKIRAQQQISKIFEIGILYGGSVVLYDQVFRPNRIVAIDHNPSVVDELENYVLNYGKGSVVKLYYGVSQDDREKMEELLSIEFPSRDIDLIVDDGSHLYTQTREAFNICFPYLSPGGLYVIEDWAWAHWAGDYWQNENAYFKDKPALSNLLIELFMLSASRPDLVSDLHVHHNKVTVRKGNGKLSVGEFDIADHYLLRGKRFAPSL